MKKFFGVMLCLLLFAVTANAFDSGGGTKIEKGGQFTFMQMVQPINFTVATISGKSQMMFISLSVTTGIMIESVIRSQRATAVYLLTNKDVGWQSYIQINATNYSKHTLISNIGYRQNQLLNSILQTHFSSYAKNNTPNRNFLRFYC